MIFVSLRKKGIALFAAAALSVTVAGGVAYTYWSGAGVGSGAAATSTTADLVIHQDTATEALFPGKTVSLKGQIHNPNPGMVRISGITGTVSVTPLAGNTCSAADYVFTGGWLEGDVETTRDAVWSGTLKMLDTNMNQDGCKGATVKIDYATVLRTGKL